MPYKDPEARKAYHKAYRERNPYVSTDESRKYDREWKRRNRQTPEGKKQVTFNNWKKGGLVGDYDAIYEIYLNTTNCMRCSIQLTLADNTATMKQGSIVRCSVIPVMLTTPKTRRFAKTIAWGFRTSVRMLVDIHSPNPRIRNVIKNGSRVLKKQ